MATKLVQDSSLTSIADAIRAKSGTSAQLEFPTDFVSAIQNIPSGSSSTTVDPLSVTQNGTYTAPTGHAYSPVTVNVSSNGGGGGNSSDPVKFIDYDGTVLYSYSVSDFMALNAMPANPTHTGLTSQGWNWSLADAKAQLTAYPKAGLTIGQMYITDDGKTRLYVHFEEGRLHPYLGICPNGTVVVDWGDNSATSTLTGTSLSTVRHADHEYASAGDYVITLTTSNGSFAFYGTSYTSHILKKNTSSSSSYIHRVYASCLQKVEMGLGASIGTYAFQYCNSLASITIPDGVTSIETYAFTNCYSLASITIPEGVTSIGISAFNGCYLLTSIAISDSVTSIGGSVFQNCYSLASITIPDGMTSIGTYTFNYCHSLASITIPDTVTSIGGSAFQYCSSLTSITIPNTVTSIGGTVFTACYSLVLITISDGVTNIGNSAFQNCYGMAEYHFESTTPPTLGTTAFKNIQSDCIIYVPTGSLEAYQTATNWSTYASYIQEEPA